jgi:cytochrome c-type biogenesis protein CcmH/NrfG
MDDEAGLAALEDAVARNPTDTDTWCRLGDAYFDLGQYEPASIAFRQATRYAPGSGWAWLGLATSLVRLGEGAEGLAAARQAARALPRSPLARA